MQEKFKFSIIMSVYNVAEYIEEAVESLLKQTIGFKKNVEIIFVNDGSTDESEEICLKYYNQYPQNIKYYHQDNKGLPAARNLGLLHTEGKYINFFDPDDILSPYVLESVYSFFQKNELLVDFVTIPLQYFEGQQGLHPKYKLLGDRTRVIDLVREPYNFILSSAASFYKKAVFTNNRFDEKMLGSEDTKFNAEIVKDKMQFGYVCGKKVRYYYRKRTAGGSNSDAALFNPKVYESILNLFDDLFSTKNQLLEYEKEIIAYELRARLRNMRVEQFDSQEAYNQILERYIFYIKKLDDDFIINRSAWLDTKDKKALFLKLKGKSFGDAIITRQISNSIHDVYFRHVSYEAGKLYFAVTYNNYGSPDFEIVAIDKNGIIYSPCHAEDLTSPYDLFFGEFQLDNTHLRKFEIPISEDTNIRILFFNKQHNSYHHPRACRLHPKSKLFLQHKTIGPICDDVKITLSKGIIKITHIDNPSSLIRKIKDVMELYKSEKRLIFSRLLHNAASRKYILLNDRPEKAGDNAEALFKYIRKSGSPCLQNNSFYILSKKSADFPRLRKYGHVVPYGSIRHKWLYLNSKIILTSHNKRAFYSPFSDDDEKYVADLRNYKLVWLQHGISMNDVSAAVNRYNSFDDKIIVATKKEKREFSSPKYFYAEKDICLTGFARFDNLKDNSKKIITIAPTWRLYLSGKIQNSGFHEGIRGFEDSDFFKQYSSLFSNRKLLNLLSESNYLLQFVLHPGMATYYDSFSKYNSENIRILPPQNASYESIFAESNLLITDYSSIIFDFAYLRKPIILFQFDRERFFREHYKKGFFDYEKDGFGEVVLDIETLVDAIEKYLNNNFQMDELFVKRVNETFEYTDRNNCQRIVEQILSI